LIRSRAIKVSRRKDDDDEAREFLPEEAVGILDFFDSLGLVDTVLWGDKESCGSARELVLAEFVQGQCPGCGPIHTAVYFGPLV
jgi:hypothetical protein